MNIRLKFVSGVSFSLLHSVFAFLDNIKFFVTKISLL